jgi:hypothetical protein
VIAKWLGHADAATTARIYADSQDEALRDAGKVLGAVVTSGGPDTRADLPRLCMFAALPASNGFRGSCVIFVSPGRFPALRGPCGQEKPLVEIVPPAGFEPAAFCSGGRRSIP